MEIRLKVLLYSSTLEGPGSKVKEILTQNIPKKYLEIHQTFVSFSNRLKKRTIDLNIVILLATDNKELVNLLSIRDQLLDLRIIVILPDREDITITQGHSLYPRFISYIDSDFRNFSFHKSISIYCKFSTSQ